MVSGALQRGGVEYGVRGYVIGYGSSGVGEAVDYVSRLPGVSSLPGTDWLRTRWATMMLGSEVVDAGVTFQGDTYLHVGRKARVTRMDAALSSWLRSFVQDAASRLRAYGQTPAPSPEVAWERAWLHLVLNDFPGARRGVENGLDMLGASSGGTPDEISRGRWLADALDVVQLHDARDRLDQALGS